jgi:type IV pilus assembly protein PilM
VASSLSFVSAFGLSLSGARRIIAVDAGSFAIKLALVETSGNSIRILQNQIINLAEEGLVAAEEIGPALKTACRQIGDYPLAMVLPQHVSLSQLVDVTAGVQGVTQLIEQEALKNRDTSDSPIVYDFVPLRPFGKHQRSFWVTLCKEADIYKQIERLGLPEEEICAVVSGANALVAAHAHQTGRNDSVVLVDLGASSTQVVVVIDGQAVHSATFPMGGNFFSETIASQKKCSLEVAENLKRSHDFFSGTDKLPALLPVVDEWRSETEKIVRDWLQQNPELNLSAGSLPIVLAGGAALQPGFIGHLNRNGKGRFALLPGESAMPSSVAVAFGAAFVAWHPGSSGSLLPSRLKQHSRKLRLHERLLAVSAVLLAVLGLLLAVGIWQKTTSISRKKALLFQAETALAQVGATESLEGDLALKYERLRPVLRRQQQTLDTLQTLALLDQTRSNRNLWYVLFADQLSYSSGRTTLNTNVANNSASTNKTSTTKAAFIAELCLNEEGEALRRTLGQVVAELKQSTLFTNVDTLPGDRRKPLADPKVLLPEKHFALAMESAGDDFQRSLLPEPMGTNQTPVTPSSLPNRATNKINNVHPNDD